MFVPRKAAEAELHVFEVRPWGHTEHGVFVGLAAVAVSERCVVSFRSPRHCRHLFHTPTDGISDRSEIDNAY